MKVIMKVIKNYIFIITTIIFGIITLIFAVKLSGLTQNVDVKLNNSSFNKEISKVTVDGKEYIALDELNGILGVNYEFSDNAINVVTENELCINEKTAIEIANSALIADWGEGSNKYIENSSVEAERLNNGSYVVSRSSIWSEGKIVVGGGYRIIVGKQGRVLVNYPLG